MSETVVILSPVKPRAPAKITQRFMGWLASCVPAAESAGYECVICLDMTGEGDKGKPPHAERSKRIADIRNQMIGKYLLDRPNLEKEWVLWLDADIVASMKPTLIPDLISVAKKYNAVVAPAVFLENNDQSDHPQCLSMGDLAAHHSQFRFYDTSGFVHCGVKTSHTYPWAVGWNLDPGIVELDGSVGCCLCSHGAYYAAGIFDAPENSSFTEHYPFCQYMKVRGLKLICSYQNSVFHAYLPSYGELFH